MTDLGEKVAQDLLQVENLWEPEAGVAMMRSYVIDMLFVPETCPILHPRNTFQLSFLS